MGEHYEVFWVISLPSIYKLSTYTCMAFFLEDFLFLITSLVVLPQLAESQATCKYILKDKPIIIYIYTCLLVLVCITVPALLFLLLSWRCLCHSFSVAVAAGAISGVTLEFDTNTDNHRRSGNQELTLVGHYNGGSATKVIWYHDGLQYTGGASVTVSSGDPCSTRKHRVTRTLTLPISSGPYQFSVSNAATPTPVRSREIKVICK